MVNCKAEIWPSWSDRWITCDSPVHDGKCVQYGHPSNPRPPAITQRDITDSDGKIKERSEGSEISPEQDPKAERCTFPQVRT